MKKILLVAIIAMTTSIAGAKLLKHRKEQVVPYTDSGLQTIPERHFTANDARKNEQQALLSATQDAYERTISAIRLASNRGAPTAIVDMPYSAPVVVAVEKRLKSQGFLVERQLNRYNRLCFKIDWRKGI